MGYPAARLGDHHECPVHTGAAVSGPGAATILIEGHAAARKGDKLTCTGGPDDEIAAGEPTVLFAGAPAARLGNLTAHLGHIDQGSPTVLVGAVPGGKAARLNARLEIISAARARAAQLPPGSQAEKDLLEAADELARLNVAVEHIRLCNAIYDGSTPEGWTRISQPGPPFDDAGTGFQAVLFRNDIDGTYVLAFRGTDPEPDSPDWLNGNSQGLGARAPQYQQAIALAQLMQQQYGPLLSLTGDSLGGGLASASALATGMSADTFNAAGLNPDGFIPGQLDWSRAPNIQAYRVNGEILTTLQSKILPPIGHQHVLVPYGGPTFDEQGNYVKGTQPTVPRKDVIYSPELDLIARLAGKRDGDARAALMEAILRHMPETVEDSIEARKTALLGLLGGGGGGGGGGNK